MHFTYLVVALSFYGAASAASSSSSSSGCCSSKTDPVLEKSTTNQRPLHGPLSWYDDSSTFVDALLEPGDRFGARPIIGDASRLRSSIQQAMDFENSKKIFKVVVLGGVRQRVASAYATLSLRCLVGKKANESNEVSRSEKSPELWTPEISLSFARLLA